AFTQGGIAEVQYDRSLCSKALIPAAIAYRTSRRRLKCHICHLLRHRDGRRGPQNQLRRFSKFSGRGSRRSSAGVCVETKAFEKAKFDTVMIGASARMEPTEGEIR